jgi:superfamily II DNA or RNA helicase
MPTKSDNIGTEFLEDAPAPNRLRDALTSGEALELHQLRQLEFWQKQVGKLDADQRPKLERAETTNLPEQWELTRGITLHEWQQRCVDAWFDAGGRGVIKVVTGAGKTILALAIAERLQRMQQPGLRVAIVVPTLVLQDQWREEFLSRSNLPETAVGLLGGGNDATFDEHTRVLICVLNSASKKLAALVQKSDVGSSLLLIVDECHRAGASEMRRIFASDRASSLGLSATPEREADVQDEDEASDSLNDDDSLPREFEDTVLGQELGPVIFELNYADAIRLDVLPPFGIRHYGLSLRPDESLQYERISREITDLRKELERPGRKGLALMKWCRSRAATSNPAAGRLVGLTTERKRLLYRMKERQNAVLRILSDAFAENPETKAILFHESIAEVMSLFKLLRAERFPVVAEHSQFPEKVRATSLKLFRDGTARIIVSARSLIEGFNVPSADLGIIVAASSSVRQRVQTLGRLLRKSCGPDGAEKHAVLYVLYATKTVDEMIYEKADWEHFVGAERNQYFLWPNVDQANPVPVSEAPRSPSPSETAVDDAALRLGETYPANVDEGAAFTRDTQGTITTEGGQFIEPHRELFEILKQSRKTAGRFRITPMRNFVIELQKTDEGWRGVYLGRLTSPVSVVNGSVATDSLQNLKPGDPYPLSHIAGKSFSVLQRDPRLIGKKTHSGVRFVKPLEEMPDAAKREALRNIQSFLKSAYSRGHRINKVTVTPEGHVVYVYKNRGVFVGEAPEREDGFSIEQ